MQTKREADLVAQRPFTAALCLALLGVACAKAQPVSTPSATGPAITITAASLDDTDRAVVSYTLTVDGKPVSDSAAAALAPAWTLAGLSVDPVTVGLGPDGELGVARPPVPAWKSYLLTGGEQLKSLPIDGPGTPDAFTLKNVQQPGSETGGAVQALGGGKYTYTFQNALPSDFDKAQTLRVGAWLQGAAGTAQTASTFDFAPGGGAAQARELVLDENCNKCHGLVQAHGGFRSGVKLCLTCHTYQNADADTVDPAAPASATPDTNPNPLDMGRLVHRIHRGKNLPTLFVASPTQPSTLQDPENPGSPLWANVSLPFLEGRNTAVLGRKFSFVGFQRREVVYGQVVNRTDNGQNGTLAATGVRYPQDLRNCDACHGGAAQASERFDDISRRTCQGCHADVWFQDSPQPDGFHFVHAGNPQVDDSQCYGCHLPTSPAPEADIGAIHVAPPKSDSWNGLTVQIVGVQDMAAGQSPTVQFTIADRDGAPSPLGSPSPATDAASPVPRALARVAITVSGPTSPDYVTGNAPITETVPLTAAADASGQFSYTFTAALPGNAAGTWAVGMEAIRSADTTFYDDTTGEFSWPFTNETLNEYADNPVVYVDVSAGTLSGGKPQPRREVVSRDNCNACHSELTAHGDLRHSVEYCLMCHAPDATDWARRPKGADQNVALGQTFDDVEERTIHFKRMIHRIHTGGRTGAAELDVARPFVIYGFGGTPNFFDDVRFPGDLANCTLCHVNGSYAIESIPASALPTVANETATVQHQANAAHASTEESTPRIEAACLACHDTGAARAHMQQVTTTQGAEQCANCHGLNAPLLGVKAAHGLR